MRLSSLSPAAARQLRLDRLRRDRTAAQVLRTAFPAIENLRLEFSFDGAVRGAPASQSHVMHPPARAFFEFPCPFADCDGQFNLTAEVAAAVTSASHQSEGSVECPGLRARDHATKQPCKLRLNYTITAAYSQEE